MKLFQTIPVLLVMLLFQILQVQAQDETDIFEKLAEIAVVD